MAIPKTTYELLYDLAIAVLGIGTWIETGTAAGVCTLAFLVAAFITDQNRRTLTVHLASKRTEVARRDAPIYASAARNAEAGGLQVQGQLGRSHLKKKCVE